jgi:acetyl esterase/lipase
LIQATVVDGKTTVDRLVRRLALIFGIVALATVALTARGSSPAWAASAGPAPIDYINYGTTNDPKQILDVYPASVANAPVVVIVHGGGWRTQGVHPPQTTQAAALQREGFAVFDINYDQDSATLSAFPTEITDVLLAIQWAINHTGLYNANPNNITLIGGSAGGQLVGMAALEAPTKLTGGAVKGVVSLSGPMNLPVLVHDVKIGTETNASLIKSVTWALGCVPLSCSAAHDVPWSPAHNVVSSTGARWLLFNSTAELMPTDQMDTMAFVLAVNGASVTTHLVPGRRHSFTYWSALDADGRTVNSTIYAFIKGL